MAWLLLALMLTFPHIFESYKAEAWPPGWREAAMFYHTVLVSMLPLVMFLFGRFFPEPFPAGSKSEKFWKFMQWAMAIPFTVFALIGAIESVIDLSNYRAAARIEHVTHPIDGIMQVFAYLLIGSFFAATGRKYGISRSTDAKRRLRILYIGSIAAWTPGLLITIYGRIMGKGIAEVLPQWVILAALVPLVLFPLTLAYVIVVQKAMDVGVAVRQGLQYALARNGVRALQIAAVIAVVSAAATLASHEGRNRPQKVAVIALGITAVFTIQRVGDRLRSWLDRRFFREAYDADHVLAELSEQVQIGRAHV